MGSIFTKPGVKTPRQERESAFMKASNDLMKAHRIEGKRQAYQHVLDLLRGDHTKEAIAGMIETVRHELPR